MSEQQEYYAAFDNAVFDGRKEARLSGIRLVEKRMTFENYACLTRRYCVTLKVLDLENPEHDREMSLKVTWSRNANAERDSRWRHSVGEGYKVPNVWKAAVRDGVMQYAEMMEGCGDDGI